MDFGLFCFYLFVLLLHRLMCLNRGWRIRRGLRRNCFSGVFWLLPRLCHPNCPWLWPWLLIIPFLSYRKRRFSSVSLKRYLLVGKLVQLLLIKLELWQKINSFSKVLWMIAWITKPKRTSKIVNLKIAPFWLVVIVWSQLIRSFQEILLNWCFSNKLIGITPLKIKKPEEISNV